MPENHLPAPTAEPDPRPSVEDLLPQWQETFATLREDAARTAQEMAALRRDIGMAVSAIRQARVWDEARSEEALGRLVSALEEGERRLADRASRLGTHQAEALASAASTVEWLAEVMGRLSSTGDISGDEPSASPGPDIVERIRDVVAEAVASASARWAEPMTRRFHMAELRLGQAAASAVTAGRETVRVPFEELRSAVEGLVEAVRAEVDGLPRGTGEQSDERLGTLLGTMEERLSQRVDEAVRSSRAALAEVRAALEASRAAEAEASVPIREDVQALRASVEHLGGQVAEAPREGFDRLEAALASLAERVSTIETLLERPMWVLAERTEAISKALAEQTESVRQTLREGLTLLARELSQRQDEAEARTRERIERLRASITDSEAIQIQLPE